MPFAFNSLGQTMWCPPQTPFPGGRVRPVFRVRLVRADVYKHARALAINGPENLLVINGIITRSHQRRDAAGSSLLRKYPKREPQLRPSRRDELARCGAAASICGQKIMHDLVAADVCPSGCAVMAEMRATSLLGAAAQISRPPSEEMVLTQTRRCKDNPLFGARDMTLGGGGGLGGRWGFMFLFHCSGLYNDCVD